MRLASWGSDLLDLLVPAGCAACGSWVPGGSAAPLVCGRCRSRLREAPWPRCPRCHFPRGARRLESADCIECHDWPAELDAARYAFVLEPPAANLVHALKYEGWRELAGPMGDAVAKLELPDAVAAPEGPVASGSAGRTRGPPRRTIVVPVPTTADRRRRRGYNQAELLARRVAEVRALPFSGALRRPREGASQTSLAPADRRRNVAGAFAAGGQDALRLRGASVLLVDDVLTTGATAGEAASALVRAGAEHVTVLAFARALPAGPRRRP